MLRFRTVASMLSKYVLASASAYDRIVSAIECDAKVDPQPSLQTTRGLDYSTVYTKDRLSGQIAPIRHGLTAATTVC